MARIRQALLYGILALFLLLALPHDRLLLTPAERLAAPHLYNLVEWETSQFLDKWWHRVWSAMPWASSPGDPEALVTEYFRLGDRERQLEADLQKAAALPLEERSQRLPEIQDMLDDLRRQRARLQRPVEETLEAAIGSVLAEEGVPLRLGPIRFPPVDFTFDERPPVLVISPRDRIQRIEDVLLDPDISLAQREQLEERILREENLSALVQGIGGIATYPSIISPSGSLLDTLIIASHEWLHHYFFFRPLGQSYRATSQLQTLNETVANLAGQEIGDRVYERLTGEKVARNGPGKAPPEEDQQPGFDFGEEMRETRLRVEELLGAGRVEEAEGYMEQRRQVFAEQGFFIRKLNQAYFAFHGTYADDPGSISPIDGELRELRELTPSLGRFLRLVSGVSSYEEFQALLERHRARRGRPASVLTPQPWSP